MLELLDSACRMAESADLVRVRGRVVDVRGFTVTAEGFARPVGSFAHIVRRAGEAIAAQVVGVQGERTVMIAMHEPFGVSAGDRVTGAAGLQLVPVGRQMLGGIVDGLGRSIDGKPAFTVEAHYPVYTDAPRALTRRAIDRSIATGIRSIDAMLTLGGGQRLGLFAGTGVGKSVLMGMIARHTSADVIVAALVGERGREVGDFLRKDLGEEGAKRTVLVVTTSDESPVLRVRAGFTATAIAEYFRDLGKDVLLLVDSTTRIAMAQRQIGLAAGEPPTTKGYPPSVFALLPRLLERSGRTQRGSITGLYAVLVEGDDVNEPIADAIRGTLDGHAWLSRDLANRGHYPAVSVLDSISRVMNDVVDEQHRQAAMTLRRVLAVWRDVEDLVNVGAYVPGASVDFDVAVKMTPVILEFLRQRVDERAAWDDTRGGLLRVADEINAHRERLIAQSSAKPLSAAPASNR